MYKIITYRDLDEEDTIIKEVVALGMHSLSIIDLKGGQQPIYIDVPIPRNRLTFNYVIVFTQI